MRYAGYFRDVETVENVVLRLLPSAATTAMMATAMPAANRPYSMAAAPCSLARKIHSDVRTTLPFPLLESPLVQT